MSGSSDLIAFVENERVFGYTLVEVNYKRGKKTNQISKSFVWTKDYNVTDKTTYGRFLGVSHSSLRYNRANPIEADKWLSRNVYK